MNDVKISDLRKYSIGILIGALLTISFSASATVVSMIGKQVDGQFPVSVEGQALEHDALIIEGTSYLPVRSFGETVGYAVYFDAEGEISLEKKVDPVVVDQINRELSEKARIEQEQMDEEARLQNENNAQTSMQKMEVKNDEYPLTDEYKQYIEHQIDFTKHRVALAEDSIEDLNREGLSEMEVKMKENYKKNLEFAKRDLQGWEDKLVDFEAKKAALGVQP